MSPRDTDRSPLLHPAGESAKPARSTAAVGEAAPARSRIREEIDPRFRWDLAPIFGEWQSWETACDELGERIDRLAAMQGTLAKGCAALLAALCL